MRKYTIELSEEEYIQKIKTRKKFLIIMLPILLLLFTTSLGFGTCCDCGSEVISKCHKTFLIIQMSIAAFGVALDLVTYILDANMLAVKVNKKKNIPIKATYKIIHIITAISAAIILASIIILFVLNIVMFAVL